MCNLVEVKGLEPLAFPMESGRSPGFDQSLDLRPALPRLDLPLTGYGGGSVRVGFSPNLDPWAFVLGGLRLASVVLGKPLVGPV